MTKIVPIEKKIINLFHSIVDFNSFNRNYNFNKYPWIHSDRYDMAIFDYIDINNVKNREKKLIDKLKEYSPELSISFFPLLEGGKMYALTDNFKFKDEDFSYCSFILYESNFDFFLINDIDYEFSFLFYLKNIENKILQELEQKSFRDYEKHIKFLKLNNFL